MISNSLIKIIKKLVPICRKEGFRIVFMGGIAISIYAMPRATYDVDAIISLEKGSLDKFLLAVGKGGFKYNRKNPIKTIHDLPFITLLYRENKIFIDLFIAKSEFQKGIIDRAKKIKIGNILVDIISPEDLILLKLQTGRHRDTEDIRNILSNNLKSLDFEYLKKWATSLGVKVFLDDEIRSLGMRDIYR